ncbi:alpha-ribazole phosphatase [Alkaliflexus imshenetskii]|uniref:alpha-ribazole phosphatase n=1 Tax=Alkaliflexus imshenetskii TaxID=286730 RepID=UPI00047A228B|nr:alpha-ribazole phosphatase [Alkaliflexus imshenetskii]
MNITLIRHIKTTAPEGICYGQTDVELPAGYKSVHQSIVSQLNHERFDVVYSSPLQRCALLAESFNQNVIFDERLKELNFGSWEMQMWSAIEKRPEAADFFNDYLNIAPPNGESYNELLFRIDNFLDDIAKRHPNQNVLVVTHGGPIRAFHVLINDLKPEEAFNLKVDYGQIFRYSLTNQTDTI